MARQFLQSENPPDDAIGFLESDLKGLRASFAKMSPALEDKLTADFPSFFVGRSKPHTESRMAEGCACDDGWYGLIHDFCCLSKWTLDHARHVLSRDGKPVVHEAPHLEFVQIKEKLGTLRLYYRLWQHDAAVEDKDPQDVQNRLLEITHRISGYKAFTYLLSSKTCELTGSAGKLRILGGLLKTLTNEKAAELGFQSLPSDHYLND